MPLADVLNLTAAEIAVWESFYQRHGFPADRLEWAAAIGASYVGATNGGKAKAKALIPVFTRQVQSAALVKAWFDRL